MLIGYMQSKTSLEVRQPQAQLQSGGFERWFMRVWNWLVEAGEARVRARIGRGSYHF